MFENNSRKGYENEQDSSNEESMASMPESERGEDHRKSKKIGKGYAGILGVLVLLLVKFKSAILLALPFLKGGLIFAKMGKFAGTFISMILTVLIYMQVYGFPFAVGFVMLIFLHEMGHSLMAKYEGLDVSAPMFIPFVGAFIRMKELPKSAMTEAKIAIGGPVLGSLAALVCYGFYHLTNDSFFLHLTYVGLLINLFNLIPLSPLDGGRVAGAISPKLWIAGLIIATAVMFWMFSPILLMIVILGAIEAYHLWKEPKPEYYAIPGKDRMTIVILYFGLVAILGFGMAAIYHGMV
ncbi:MAG: site-2 protease family protein [Bacillota bacterium]